MNFALHSHIQALCTCIYTCTLFHFNSVLFIPSSSLLPSPLFLPNPGSTAHLQPQQSGEDSSQPALRTEETHDQVWCAGGVQSDRIAQVHTVHVSSSKHVSCDVHHTHHQPLRTQPTDETGCVNSELNLASSPCFPVHMHASDNPSTRLFSWGFKGQINTDMKGSLGMGLS